jgi:cobalt-zinc-cadmium resistance protein CzcA
VLGHLYLQVQIDPQAISRFGVNMEDVNDAIEMGVGGKQVGQIVEGNRRANIVLRYAVSARDTPEAIANLLIDTPENGRIPLSMLAHVDEVDGPVQITRESTERQVVIQANVQDRDVVGFVDEVRTSIARDVQLPEGSYVTFGGQFENQQRVAARLGMVVPLSIALIWVLLFLTFRSVGQATLIVLNVPFAMIGGVIALFASGLYLSVPASVGFITLFGVAVLNGVVMVAYFNQLRASGRTVREAAEEGAERRLRPVLMTALIASFGLVPLLVATGPGSELQRPLAIVVIGGLVSSTFLTLLLVPTLYVRLETRFGQAAREAGVAESTGQPRGGLTATVRRGMSAIVGR